MATKKVIKKTSPAKRPAAVKKSAAKKVIAKKAVAKKISRKKSVAKKAVAIKKTSSAKTTSTGKIPVVRNISPGGIAKIRHLDFKANKPFQFDKSKIDADVIKKFRNSPTNLEITLEPKEGDFLVYHPTPGFTSNEPPLAQFSIQAIIYNKGTKTVDLDEVVLEYKKGNQTIKKDVFLPSGQLIIEPWYAWAWQNSRPYHEPGDVVFLESPFPDKITLSFHFKNYSGPISVTKNCKPYSQALGLPFDSKDFAVNEYVTGYSMHGGGEQVFAYDLGVQAYESDAWQDLLPNKNWNENANYRIWGKPIHAMADGIVLHFENNIPNNWKPDGSDAGMKKQQDELWGSFDYGGSGNHFYIRHGNNVALYAHMQKGSLNSSLLQKGKAVKKGDVLGKAGNSGNSTGPHTHVHVKTYKNDNEPEGGTFRPLLFNTGFAIGQANYPKPKSNVNWSKLNKQGIPGLKGKACFVFPSDTHPYCAYPTNWGEVCKFGIIESSYQKEIDSIWPCGYYPVWVDGYDVAGHTYFNVIFRPSQGIQWVARHNMDANKYQDEFNTRSDAGYRLIHINSYLLKGKVRYAAVWKKDSSVDWFAYHAQTLAWHESNFEKNYKAGWIPANVSCVYAGGQTYVSALWEKKNTGGFYLKPEMTLQDFVSAFEQYTNKEKFKLVYLDGYVKGGKPRLSGIWYKNAPDYNSWWEKYHLSGSQFQTEYNSMLHDGYLTRCIAGYSDGGAARFEGVWSK